MIGQMSSMVFLWQLWLISIVGMTKASIRIIETSSIRVN